MMGIKSVFLGEENEVQREQWPAQDHIDDKAELRIKLRVTQSSGSLPSTKLPPGSDIPLTMNTYFCFSNKIVFFQISF